MKRLASVILGTITLVLLPPAQSAQTPQCAVPTYDAVRDWSSDSNPNGAWSYGYLSLWGAPFTLYTLKGSCNVPNTSAWWIAECTDPLVAHNDSGKEECGTTYCLPPAYLAFHPGANGELSVVRWTAPRSGKYAIRARFQGQDWFFPTSTNVYVVVNSKNELLKAPINSYKDPVIFNAANLKLQAGATLDFMVDFGQDASYVGDSTGVAIKIVAQNP